MAEPGDAILSVRGLGKRYAARDAVRELDLELAPGEIHGFVGANGGGKTTSLRMLAGILRADAGRGRVLGFDLRRDAGEIRRHVGYMAQRLSLYADLTVTENLRFRADVYGLRDVRGAVASSLDEFGLEPYARTPARSLSGGWARRAQLAAALIHRPRLLLLDEPSVGLDAGSRQALWRGIARRAADGAGVIVSSHDPAEAERCATVSFFAEGRILASGRPDAVTRRAAAHAFRLAGPTAPRAAQRIEAAPGILACMPEAGGVRVLASFDSEDRLRRLLRDGAASITPVALRLEDAALVLARESAR